MTLSVIAIQTGGSRGILLGSILKDVKCASYGYISDFYVVLF